MAKISSLISNLKAKQKKKEPCVEIREKEMDERENIKVYLETNLYREKVNEREAQATLQWILIY